MTASPNGATQPTRAASLEFQNVSKSYAAGGAAAVHDLSFTVPAGSICILVGPSGCGKTTTLRMINRLVEPTSGRILLDGRDIGQQDKVELRRRIGYVIQQVGLFPHLTVGANVAVVPELLGWPKARRRDRADELLALVGLDPAKYSRRYPRELSGGERQRVGVARALAADPPLLLMDEPFGAVDPIVRERLQNELLGIQQRLARTIVFVTHDIDEAIKLGDVVAVYNANGTIAQYGTPDEILANPASDFVARFVGADRDLKRLALTTVEHLRTQPVDGYAATSADDRPTFAPRTTLREALSVLLAGDSNAGLVLTDDGQARGLITIEEIAAALQRGYRSLDGHGPDGSRPDVRGPAEGGQDRRRTAEPASRP